MQPETFIIGNGNSVPTAETSGSLSGPARKETVPDNIQELLSLSRESEALFSMLAASGCCAAAYYRYIPAKGYRLERQVVFYENEGTFEPWLESSFGNGMYKIPVRSEHGDVVGIIALQPADNAYNREESYYHRSAKLNLAQHLLEYHQRALAGGIEKRDFLMTITKDMFFSFSTFSDELVESVYQASDAGQMKEAFRAAVTDATCSQHKHVIGVADLMDHAVIHAVNADPRFALGTHEAEIITFLALLHDIGKTQMPSYMFSGWAPSSREDHEYYMERNGNHPLFTWFMLSLLGDIGLASASHHHGLRRYGSQEKKHLKEVKKVNATFRDFTFLKKNDIPTARLSALSCLMRVADVAESISGVADLPLHEALRQMAAKVTYDRAGRAVINPDTIDPDYLCFMIASGAFDAYGSQKAAEQGRWVSRRSGFAGCGKYDAAALREVGNAILSRFGWDKPEARKIKETGIRIAIASSFKE